MSEGVFCELKQLIAVCERHTQDTLGQKRLPLTFHSRTEITPDHKTQAVRKSTCCKEVRGTDRGTQISGGTQGSVEKGIQILNPGSNAVLGFPQESTGHVFYILISGLTQSWRMSKLI